MEEDVARTVAREIAGAIEEIGFDPDVLKEKVKSCLSPVFIKETARDDTVRWISRGVIRGSLKAAAETKTDPASLGGYVGDAVLEELREFSQAWGQHVATAQDAIREALREGVAGRS